MIYRSILARKQPALTTRELQLRKAPPHAGWVLLHHWSCSIKPIRYGGERVAPALEDAELAWELGSGRLPADVPRAARAFRKLLRVHESVHGIDAEVRVAAARRLARAGRLRDAIQVAPSLPRRVALERTRRIRETRAASRTAARRLAELSESLRVTVVSPEPTPYRAPLFDRVRGRWS